MRNVRCVSAAFFLVVMIFGGWTIARAQYLNLQHHFDFGRERHYFTNTLEGLAVDGWGAWFGFIDVDHRSRRSGTAGHDWQPGAQLIYFEINRYFGLSKFFSASWMKSWDFTVQYNDSDAGFIPYAYLIGFSKNGILGKWLDAHLEFLFRKEEGERPGWQLTGVWFREFHVGQWPWQVSGYFDLWKNDFGRFFMAEPQLLFSLRPLLGSRRFWLGTEWELNWGEEPQYRSINPTLFLRYDF
ncbi:MAG TPA: DUF5020 family protein [Bacteroidetes bacterium]|nr:DUF5020 family protein [Bacteroidota bacterium]